MFSLPRPIVGGVALLILFVSLPLEIHLNCWRTHSSRPAKLTVLLLLRRHLLWILRLGLLVIIVLRRRMIERLLGLVALLVRLFPCRLVWLVIRRLLRRLVVRWLLLRRVALLPRITHAPD